ncbi:MAG TPA: TOBE domain-containing protein [Desulfomicrobiaceae bacterium]|nr:TOBE domain-containing protein [Desulfomicrobiaceae bacterium]
MPASFDPVTHAPHTTTRLFTVPENLRHLTSEQLKSLTESFRTWFREAESGRFEQARARIFFLYQLLRYSGARLGEILSVDETRDIDFDSGIIRITGEDGTHRSVIIPDTVTRDLLNFLERGGDHGIRTTFFHLDQGYVRRKFREQAERSGLPRELLCPQVLRDSRAVELLQGGAPVPAVRAMLGLGRSGVTERYLAMNEADMKWLMQGVLDREMRKKTSARNSFIGTVTGIRSGTIMSEVQMTTAAGYRLVSVITNESMHGLGVAPGRTLNATIKAPWVIVSREQDVGTTSTRNRLQGTITRINSGDISAEVVGILDDGSGLCALITDGSVRDLGLSPGDRVWFLFKAFSVILNAV